MAPFRRRWLSFSLRGLLAAVTLICVWFGWNVERKRRHQAIIAAIHDLGGEVVYERPPNALDDLLYGPNDPIEVNLISRSASDATVSQLRQLTKLRRLRMRGAYVTDTGMADLGAMNTLETLELFYPFITDNGLKHIENLTRLRKLTVTDARVTDDGLTWLAGLKDLDELTLKDLKITSAGLVHTQRLTKLTKLTLTGFPLDDDAVQVLQNLKSLKTLDLRGSKVSFEARTALRRALPGCKTAAFVEKRIGRRTNTKSATRDAAITPRP